MISEDIKLDPVDDHPVEPPRRWLVRSPETWHEMARVVEATQTAQVYGCFVDPRPGPRRREVVRLPEEAAVTAAAPGLRPAEPEAG
jgi:hypothetical protein